jgi:hypothetical protein
MHQVTPKGKMSSAKRASVKRSSTKRRQCARAPTCRDAAHEHHPPRLLGRRRVAPVAWVISKAVEVADFDDEEPTPQPNDSTESLTAPNSATSALVHCATQTSKRDLPGANFTSQATPRPQVLVDAEHEKPRPVRGVVFSCDFK